MLDSLTHMFLLVQYTLLLSFLDILWLLHALVYILIQNSFWKFVCEPISRNAIYF